MYLKIIKDIIQFFPLFFSETPEVDMEKFKPVKYDLNTSMEVNTPSKWVAGSEPLGAGTQGFTQSIGKMEAPKL